MQKSANYGLKLFEGTDNVKRQDFVDNFQTIDTQLKKISDNLGNSAQKDSTMQKGLNAEMVGGKRAGDFTSAYDSFNQDSTDLNSYNSNKTWTARAGSSNPNAPSPISNYSTVLNVGSDNNSNFQIAGAYDGSNRLGYRCRHDTDGVYGGWKRILTEDDYNSLFQSATDVKSKVANAINGKGGSANSGMTGDQLASAVNTIHTGPNVLTGSFVYSGDTVTVHLPFTPKLVTTYGQTTNSSTTYLDGHTVSEPYSSYTLTIIDNGFTQHSGMSGTQTWQYVAIG